MHMADALVSPAIAGVTGIISGALVVVAARKIRKSETENIVPLMGVMGAFIFAAQMINFSIPGTGSSGHIVGGILLAALLGPWAGFLTLTSVLIIQCLIFADGGLMALGCNIFNMAACTCLIAYPLVYKPLVRYPVSFRKILGVSILTCVIGLELGALAVTVETEASGITALPMGQFLLFMVPIHLAIGIGEGVATAGVLYFIQRYKSELLVTTHCGGRRSKRAVLIFAVLAFVIGGAFSWIASSDPDGLEWSVYHVTGADTEPAVSSGSEMYDVARNIQETTAVMPDYNTTFAGIIGGVIVVLVVWGLSGLLQYKKKVVPEQ